MVEAQDNIYVYGRVTMETLGSGADMYKLVIIIGRGTE